LQQLLPRDISMMFVAFTFYHLRDAFFFFAAAVSIL